jgi:hypothetical protein
MSFWGSASDGDAWPPNANMKTTLKDGRKVYARIKGARGLDEHEKILCARSLAAMPDERWQMNETFLRSSGLWGRSALRTFGSNS